MKTTTLPIKHSLNRSRCPLALLFIPFVLVCFALAPSNDAQCPQICDSTYQNTAVGDSALIRNTTGANNTAIGFNVLEFNTTGGGNTATGFNALGLNTFGNSNTASGSDALAANTTGDTNTATGFDTLLNSTTGNGNYSFIARSDAPTCPECGSIMIPNGSCHKCVNCGTTSGCS